MFQIAWTWKTRNWRFQTRIKQKWKYIRNIRLTFNKRYKPVFRHVWFHHESGQYQPRGMCSPFSSSPTFNAFIMTVLSALGIIIRNPNHIKRYCFIRINMSCTLWFHHHHWNGYMVGITVCVTQSKSTTELRVCVTAQPPTNIHFNCFSFSVFKRGKWTLHTGKFGRTSVRHVVGIVVPQFWWINLSRLEWFGQRRARFLRIRVTRMFKIHEVIANSR